MGVPFTPEEDERLLRLFVSGITYREIGETMGRSIDSVRHRLGRLGFSKAHKIEFTEPQIAAIKMATSRGWSPGMIARKIGRDVHEVMMAIVA